MRNHVGLGVLLTLLSMITGIDAMTAAKAHGAVQPVVVPLKMYLGVVPSLQVRVAGHDTTFLLDTAGGLTVLTPQAARAVGCRPWGRLTGFRMRGDRIDMKRCDKVVLRPEGARLGLPEVGVWDIGRLLPKGAPPIGGSIALDAFAGRAVTLDLAGGRLVLETPRSLVERVRHARSVPVRFKREVDGAALVPLIGVRTPRGRLWMELDCGSDGGVLVNRPVASALGLDPSQKGTQQLSARLGRGIRLRAKANVMDLILDGNIGAPVLRRWIITLDLAHRRMWLAPRRAPAVTHRKHASS